MVMGKVMALKSPKGTLDKASSSYHSLGDITNVYSDAHFWGGTKVSRKQRVIKRPTTVKKLSLV